MKRIFFGVLMVALAACGERGNDAATTTQGDTAVTTETSVTQLGTTDTAATATTDTSATDTTATTTAPPATTGGKQEKPMSTSNDKVAELHTTAGEIHIRFFPDVAPNHVKNFLDLAQQGAYNGTKFHRIIPGFMIQGGDPNTISGDPSSWGTGGSKNNLKAEFNTVSHKRGIVSMARSQHVDSASSQFFIVVADSTFLDRQYTVFGQVTKGMDVADKIVSAQKGANDRPHNPTTITKVVVRDAQDSEKGPAPK
ncbi:MAG TPA: peptidylprolyl isomerase [Thermoanaerobaculia bacterium]|nr:peptidylprolyl isomerase [Thermoanaerobaculia bacterium]